MHKNIVKEEVFSNEVHFTVKRTTYKATNMKTMQGYDVDERSFTRRYAMYPAVPGERGRQEKTLNIDTRCGNKTLDIEERKNGQTGKRNYLSSS